MQAASERGKRMAAQEKLLTVEEFWEIYAGKPYELVEGRVIEVNPAGVEASATAARVVTRVSIFVDAHTVGMITGTDGGYKLGQDTLRALDVAYFSNTKLAQLLEPEKYAPFAPDLAVEVVSANDTATEGQARIALYLEAGVKLIWVFYPQRREVEVHFPDRTAKTLTRDQMLDGGDALPGFQVRINDLFSSETASEPE